MAIQHKNEVLINDNKTRKENNGMSIKKEIKLFLKADYMVIYGGNTRQYYY